MGSLQRKTEVEYMSSDSNASKLCQHFPFSEELALVSLDASPCKMMMIVLISCMLCRLAALGQELKGLSAVQGDDK